MLFLANPKESPFDEQAFNVQTMDNLWEFKDFSGRLRFSKQTHTCIFRLITSIQIRV